MARACVSQRCGLCAFELQEGDKIVAITDEGQQSGEMSNTYLMEDESGAAFSRCLGACPHLDGQTIGCHTGCAKHVPSTSLALLLRVLAYQYEPSPFEIARRMQWIHLRFASTTPILTYAKPHLPQELRLQIATHLLQSSALHQYAVAHTDTLLENRGSSDSCIRLSAEIWARFITFEGVRYIASLANSSDDYHTESVFKPDPQNLSSIYIAENYLGVMQVLFSTTVQAPAVKERQGLWWRIIPLRGCETVLNIRTDGAKLRSIAPETKGVSSCLHHPLWSLPPSKPVRPVQLEPSPPAAQLLTLTYNALEVTAYSVCWKGGIIYLHAHFPGEDFAFYKGYKGIWVYFPLEKGERISEIWKRYQFRQSSSLLYKTTYNRVALFGPQPNLHPPAVPTLIDLPPKDRGSRLFFENSPLGHLKSTFFESYFYSTAKLDGVNKIMPCQRYVHGK
ncbi:hypothetical protein LY76DRAFT_398607 [Colletotrichum caudatum]|nr:hypothetical protein LY76DRAFT_398607 [Colletotrichum caudatum]